MNVRNSFYLFIGQLQQHLLCFIGILSSTTNGDTSRPLFLRKADLHSSTLLHNVLEHLTLGSNDSIVELGVNVNGFGDNIGLLSLNLQNAIAGCFSILLRSCRDRKYEN